MAAAIAAATVTLMGLSATPAAARDDGLHHLMVTNNGQASSIYINTQTRSGAAWTVCRQISKTNGWVDGNMDLVNGKKVEVIAFTSTECTAGYLKSSGWKTTPGVDGSDNFWVALL